MLPSIGIDVHKETLVVASSVGEQWSVQRNAAGLRDLTERLTRDGCSIVVVEPSGGFEHVVLTACWEANIPVARVNSYQLRAYARGEGLRAKTDVIDAKLMVRFADHHRPRPLKKPDIMQIRLRTLIRARAQLTKTRTQTAHQLEQASSDTRACFQSLLQSLHEHIADLTARIEALITSAHRSQRVAAEILTSAPGIGATTASMLIAEVPELGCVDAKSLASMLGVVPITQQSGTSMDYGHCYGGRGHVRSALYFPTISAMQHNPTIRAFAARMRARGKRGKVVIIACMHKLITILNAMVRNDEMWHQAQVQG